MNNYDRALAEWVLKWLPFGGPRREDMFEQFGLPHSEAVRRVLDIPGQHESASLHAADRIIVDAISSQIPRLRALLRL